MCFQRASLCVLYTREAACEPDSLEGPRAGRGRISGALLAQKEPSPSDALPSSTSISHRMMFDSV